MMLKKLIVIAGLAGTLGVAAPAFAAGWHSGGAVRGGGGACASVSAAATAIAAAPAIAASGTAAALYRPIARPGYGYGVAAPATTAATPIRRRPSSAGAGAIITAPIAAGNARRSAGILRPAWPVAHRSSSAWSAATSTARRSPTSITA